MSYRLRVALISIAAALLVGFALRPLDRHIASKNEMPLLPLQSADLASSVGQGLSLAVLGGYRSAVANLAWLSLNQSWESKDHHATLAHIRLAVAIDPRPLFFWLNGSRIIANDMPAWLLEERGIDPDSVSETRKALQARFAHRALDFLKQALETHADSADLFIEQAVIHRWKLNDASAAAELFLEASVQPDAPYLAARLYAAMLIELGKKKDAYDYLLRLLPTLPADDPMAMKLLVAQKTRELERELSESR